MLKTMFKTIVIFILLIIIFYTSATLITRLYIPETITYGASFSKLHAEELDLDWKQVYLAALDELGVRHFRFSAHWSHTELKNNEYDFSTLDFQMNEARKRGADVILAVGRRLPGWPECHEPQWVWGLSQEEKQQELLSYIETVVNRYKDYPNLKYWQVENEAFLHFYARHHCQDFFSTEFFDSEIALVKKLDPDTPIFLTDSGELSLWYQAYKRADVFGTSVYIYIWNHYVGQMRYPITPGFFRVKHLLMKLLLSNKPAVLSELSLEPWLLQPIKDTPIDMQLSRMDTKKFDSIISFASQTDFDQQYLWGLEWWYWMKNHNHPEFWDKAKQLYQK